MNDRQKDEIEALKAMYNDDELDVLENEDGPQVRYRVQFQGRIILIATFQLSQNYPELKGPEFKLKQPYGQNFIWLSQSIEQSLLDYLTSLWTGQEVLYDCIVALQEQCFNHFKEICDKNQSAQLWIDKRLAQKLDVQSTSNADTASIAIVHPVDTQIPVIFSSEEPVVDKKSVFVAHMARLTSKDQIEGVMQVLLNNSKIRKASHNIIAYRTSLDSGYDDDGESGAGSRLLALLENAAYQNVVVIVSRWFGGIKLGHDRFRHINNVAKKLLTKNYR